MAVLSLLLVNSQPLGCAREEFCRWGLLCPHWGALLSLPWGPFLRGLIVGVIKSGPWQELVPTQLVSKMSGFGGLFFKLPWAPFLGASTSTTSHPHSQY